MTIIWSVFEFLRDSWKMSDNEFLRMNLHGETGCTSAN